MRRRFFLVPAGAVVALLVFAAPSRATSGPSEALIAAVEAGDLSRVQTLLAEGAPANSWNEKGVPALALAAGAGDAATVKVLLDAGAKVDALGEFGASPLMYAAKSGSDDVIALLVERGADVSRKMEEGLTALDLAKAKNLTLTIDLLENGGRQEPPAPEFQRFRPLLFPEFPLESLFLQIKQDDQKFETVRQLAVKGDLQQARSLLEAGREELQGQSMYWWELAYFQRELGDKPAALASLHKILVDPTLGSRDILRAWMLLQGLGEVPPPEQSKLVLGVVFELGAGARVIDVAAYADGQPRFLISTGGGVIGESWTADETGKVHEIVRLAQEEVDGMAPNEGRELPKPGRFRLIVMTPSGSYGAEGSIAHQSQGRSTKIVEAGDQLVSLLFKHLQEVEAERKP